jgi:thioredoxin
MTVLAVTDATFETEVLAAELPVLIDLYADWCEPCKQLSPVVASLAAELQGVVKVVKIDVERSPGVAQMFRVQSIPMLVVMQGGRPVAAEQGVLNKAQLLEMLAPVLPQTATALKPDELAQLLKQAQVLPVDVRDERSFGRFRIPGAINVPLEAAPERVAELVPSDGRLRVLYSRTEDEAKRLAEELGKQGVEVGYLAGGFLHWEADGLEVERG